MNKVSPRVSGIVSVVRADATNLPAALTALTADWESFKTEQNAALAELKKTGANDPLTLEKIERANADITTLTSAVNEAKAAIDALRVGGGGSEGVSAEAREHATAFNQFFRKGAEAGLRELEVKAALTTDSDPSGGYLVPEQTDAEIDRVLGTVSAIRSISRVVSIGGGTYKKIVNLGGTGSGWVAERAARPETGSPSLSEISINAGELYANPATTQRLLDDASFDVERWLAEEVSVEFAEEEGAAFVSGDGINKPRGFLSYTTAANASYAWGGLGYVVTGAAADFASSNPGDALIDLYYGLKAGYRAGASFVTSDAILGKIRKFKDGQGNYLWAPPTADMPGTILGKPVVTDDNMPNVAAGAFPVAFGNFSRGYLISDVGATAVLRDPYTNKPYVHFYTTKRVGGAVVNFEAIKLLKCSA